VERGLYAALQSRCAVTPLLWSNGWQRYCTLAATPYRYLTAPFQQDHRATEQPGTLATPFPWSKSLRHLRRAAHRIHLERVATAADTLVVPEIFQDLRMRHLPALCAAFPGRTVAVFHDAVPLRMPAVTHVDERRTFPRYVRALASFHHVICPTREVADDLRFYWSEWGVGGGRISVQPWPTDFGSARPLAPAPLASRRILCVASFHRRKNHLGLLAAAELLWSAGLDFELLFIGRTNAHGGPAVIAEIKRLTCRGRPLRWLRHVDDQTLHGAYRDCLFSVYPSWREGFGLPILESLWHGRPCVCGGNGALGEVAAGGGCLLVDQTDPVALAAGLRRLLTDAALYHELHSAAQARAFRTWDDYAAALLADMTC